MISKIAFAAGRICLAILCLLCFCLPADAQNQDEQFIKTAAIAGLNFSQVDGDDIAGYNKIGLNVGGTALVKFHRLWSLGFELIYSQKGSRQQLPPDNSFEPYRIAIDYFDVPVLLSLHDRGRAIFSGGFSYGRLVRHREFADGAPLHNEPEFQFRKADVQGIASVTFFVMKQQLALNLRYAYSLGFVRQRPESNFLNKGQYNNTLSARMFYFFNY